MPPDHPAAALDQKVGYAKTWLPKKGVYLVLVPPERTQLLQFKPNKLCRVDPTLQEWEERRDAAAPGGCATGPRRAQGPRQPRRAQRPPRRGHRLLGRGQAAADAAHRRRRRREADRPRRREEPRAGRRLARPQRDEIPVVDELAERLRPVTDEQGGPLSDDAALLASLVSVVEEGFDGACRRAARRRGGELRRRGSAPRRARSPPPPAATAAYRRAAASTAWIADARRRADEKTRTGPAGST